MAKEELNQALNCHFEGPVSNGGGKDAFHSVPLSKPGQGEIRDAVESVLTGTLTAVAEVSPFRFGSGSKLPRSLKASRKPLLPLSQQIRKRFKELSHGRDLFPFLIEDRRSRTSGPSKTAAGRRW